MTLSLTPGPRTGRARRGGACPSSDEASWSETGSVRLRVVAPGRWSARVEQQLDTPLHQPPLSAMRAPGARLLARGRFHPIESSGNGLASLYRLPSGRLALRLERLRTTANPDLLVWVSERRAPSTSEQVGDSPHVRLGGLKSTRGDQNYLLPRELDRDDVGSVVIWQAQMHTAYTAAALE